MNEINWAFFGTSSFSTLILDEMKKKGLVPTLIITTPDKPKGRKLVLTPPEAKVWADKENIPVLQLSSLKTDEAKNKIMSHFPNGADLFVVASYGKIIPQNILDLPKHKTLNVHPSLLPKLRGPSPMISSILEENETGVTIMRLDEEMDHGPIIAQQKIEIDWPPYALDLEKALGQLGGQMMAEAIPKWLNGELNEKEQDHQKATYCKKITKEDGLLNLSEDAEINLRKIRAYHNWPGAYFFENRGHRTIRVIVKRAHVEDGNLVIERVTPEGKKEMDYSSYLRGKEIKYELLELFLANKTALTQLQVSLHAI